ncbi:hypothetical protein C9374_008548 [Naegleria lovaniensis]|uniref:Uracil-DNA glycosylase n=1 Tax=Naegleria lovaniensis TaxID=51637 RepID=A0AA88GJU0_NAELO|nr:uncharacterized protein C9374_008548 [Naegleria lovaniensis]KAG2378405.1 hypothetical protein C9374_008548 [Naegleria lovaniensis]
MDAAKPNCNCNKPAQVSTVKKDGPNHGRLFATCTTRDCKYFEWLDGNKKMTPTSSSSSSNNFNFGLNSSSSGKVSSFSDQNDGSKSTIPKCQHNQDAMLLRVKKVRPNQGRLFWTCANSQSDKCSFFSWFSGKEEDFEHLIGVKPTTLTTKETSFEVTESEKKRKLKDETNQEDHSDDDTPEPSSVAVEEPQRKKMKETSADVVHYKEKPKQIFPKKEEIFSALNACSFDNVKVVILGQDPYPQWYAHGMSFSVKKGITTPKSLQNIYAELEQDENLTPRFTQPNHGYLMGWAQQGVLLLNAVLTVESGKSNEHKGIGWEQFTDAIINKLKEKKNIVYLLWGKDAQEKGSKIDRKNNLVIQTSHPSPFSANKGFLGSKCFSKCNEYLTNNGLTTINWNKL